MTHVGSLQETINCIPMAEVLPAIPRRQELVGWQKKGCQSRINKEVNQCPLSSTTVTAYMTSRSTESPLNPCVITLNLKN